MTKLLTRNDFASSPKDIFKKIEEQYFFGKQRKNHAEIIPYFLMTDGNDIIIMDDGAKRSAGIGITFMKRPKFFCSRFWNRGPAEFSKMITRFIFGGFLNITGIKDEPVIKKVQVIETLCAIYSIDRKQVHPIYIVKLPDDEPLHLNFTIGKKFTAISLTDFLANAIIGTCQFDTMSTAVAFLISMKEILIPGTSVKE